MGKGGRKKKGQFQTDDNQSQQQRPQSQPQQTPQSQPQQTPQSQQQQQKPQSQPQKTPQSQQQQKPQSQPQQKPQSQPQQTPQSQQQQQKPQSQPQQRPQWPTFQEQHQRPQSQQQQRPQWPTSQEQHQIPQSQSQPMQSQPIQQQQQPQPQQPMKSAWKKLEPPAQQETHVKLMEDTVVQQRSQIQEKKPQTMHLPMEAKPKQIQTIPSTTVSDVQQITHDLSKLPTKDRDQSSTNGKNGVILDIPQRKNPLAAGTLGRRIEVFTNMLQIKLGPKFQPIAVHYDVDIVPNIPKYLLRTVFKEAKKKLFPQRNPAFDGKKNAFSCGYLPIDSPTTISVIVYNEDGKEKNFQVTIKFANEINLSWLKKTSPGMQLNDSHQISIQALDIILRDAPSQNTTIVGRSFFTPPKGHVMSLGGGMDLWVGLFQSAVLGWKPFLNVDVVHKGFPKSENVIEAMKSICLSAESRYQQGQDRNLNDPDVLLNLIRTHKEAIRSFLKNLKVTVEIPGQPTSRRTQRIVDLVKPPRDNIFECNNKQISVEQYYRFEKKYNIRYPTLPCLWVGPRDKNIHVPPEICTIVPGQATQKTLTDNQTASMVKYAATGTNIRKQKIMDVFNSMDYARNPCMKEFDISISGEFEKVPARVLDPPKLRYNNRIAQVNKGVWRPDKFLTPSSLISANESWTILNLNQSRNQSDKDLYALNNALIKRGQNLGLTIGKPLTPFKTIFLRGSDIRDLFAYFNDQKRKGLKLIIVVIPETKGHYSKVKQITELNIGVLTQCLKAKTLMRLSDATVDNILLKINAKLNGVNHQFETTVSRPKCLERPCMIVGADVTHPSPDATDIPSIAAVAASHDPNAFMYNIEIRLQPPRQEVISNLTEIMMIQLRYFRQKTNFQPQKIIFYRDGVSEGQFQQIMNVELKAIQAACLKLNETYKPQITFLVVQKRHHIRLFPTSPQFSDDAHKNFNVQAGTIVDTNITHPTHIDFYLVSHASIQGTARPTKYRCLWDDSDMSEDEIEKLTYFLCHMFSRCTRSVSYPTPTYYAHLAAFRARALTHDVPIKLNDLQHEQQKKLTINSEILKNMPMFFV